MGGHSHCGACSTGRKRCRRAARGGRGATVLWSWSGSCCTGSLLACSPPGGGGAGVKWWGSQGPHGVWMESLGGMGIPGGVWRSPGGIWEAWWGVSHQVFPGNKWLGVPWMGALGACMWGRRMVHIGSLWGGGCIGRVHAKIPGGWFGKLHVEVLAGDVGRVHVRDPTLGGKLTQFMLVDSPWCGMVHVGGPRQRPGRVHVRVLGMMRMFQGGGLL